MIKYPEQINTIEKFNQKSYKEKGSEFIGRVYHVEEENEIVETDSVDDEGEGENWKIDWALIYQEENRKVIPPT